MESGLTYIVPLPIVLFLRTAFPPWRRFLGWGVIFLAAFAGCALAADAVLQRPHSARTPKNLIAIGFMVVSLALLFRPGWRPGRDMRTLRVGLVSWVLTAVADNLRGLGALSWRGSEVEPVGATVLIACLGTMAARRAFEGAERLVAIERELSIARRIQSSILIASMVKVAIAAQKAQADRPAAVLAGMNETLRGQLGGQYVTAAYLFLDREAGTMHTAPRATRRSYAGAPTDRRASSRRTACPSA